jgi:primosomal protein N' (replication factor Y) (superfamily II helicase)
MIAKIVPAVRLPTAAAEQFEYSVPDALTPAVGRGSVVVIPFAGRRVSGLVMSISTEPESGKALKSVIGVAQGLNRLPLPMIDAWEKLVGLFATTWPRWCWMALPAVPSRSVQVPHVPMPNGVTQERGEAAVSSLYLNRPDDQLIAVKKMLEKAGQGQALILVPTVREAYAWAKVIGGDIAVYHSKLSTGAKYAIACSASNADKMVVIGTKSAVLLPFADLRAAVIVAAGSSSHKQEDSDPRFDARIAAEELCHASGARFLALDAWPPIGRWDSLNASRHVEFLAYDLSDAAKREKAKVLFDENLEKALGETVGKGGRALVLLNRRGLSSALACRDCGTPAACPDCGMALTAHRDRLSCAFDERSYPLPAACVKCGSANLRPLGSGSQTLSEYLKKRFPGTAIAHFDRDETNADADAAQIVVGTSAVFRALSPAFKPFDMAIDAHLGAGTAKGGYDSIEETVRLLRMLAACLVPGGLLHIQTFDREAPALKALSDPNAALSLEFEERRAFGFPPDKTLITIYGSGTDETKLWDEANRLFKTVGNRLPQAICAEPIWSRPKLFRKKYRLTVSVKIPPSDDYSGLIKLLPSGFAAEARII